MITESVREVYRNAWMAVTEHRVRQNGVPGVFGIVEKADFALVVPCADDGGLWLVDQYRYAVRRRAWEFPQGSWSHGQHGDSEALAVNELREETGFHAEQLRHLGRLHIAYGFCTQACDFYSATCLRAGPADREVTEQDMRQRRVSRSEFVAMIRRGDIVDTATVSAYCLLLLHEQGAGIANRFIG
jgi:8-oxo-dGTP pyrophosphatase MutT (NUDIX family)